MALSIFSMPAREYEHIVFDATARTTATLVIVAIAIGIVLAALYNFYLKAVPGGIVRALLAAEAHTPESARSLGELPLSPKALYAFALAHDLSLRSLILRAEGEGERLFIPEDKKDRAAVRFEARGNGVLSLAVSVAVAVAVALLLIWLLPAILGAVDALL